MPDSLRVVGIFSCETTSSRTGEMFDTTSFGPERLLTMRSGVTCHRDRARRANGMEDDRPGRREATIHRGRKGARQEKRRFVLGIVRAVRYQSGDWILAMASVRGARRSGV